jgi:tRNA(Ile)-lysidine synthase
MNARVAVAVSGGRDSMALLHCTARAAQAQGLEVWALHVHHGLQAEADEWAGFVEHSCRRWAAKGLPLRHSMRRLEGRPGPGDSVEAWARAGRYAALGAMAREAGCALVMLAHHRSDQAETFLLQALRGAGPAGLASMPAQAEREGLRWVRPWLEQPREAIEAYVRRHRIRFIDDASNADRRFARNRLRLEVLPALQAAFPDAPAALAAAARQAARARALIDEIAQADAVAVSEGDALVLSRWSALSDARRHESLRAWLAARIEQPVSEAQLARLVDELPGAPPARWPLDGIQLLRYRGRLRSAALGGTPSPAWPCAATVARAGLHRVPGTDARLRVRAVLRAGLPLRLLDQARWQAREGGERFQRAGKTPARSLKKQFQAAGIPAWSRTAPLLVAQDGMLLFVPGLGTDARALAATGGPRVSLEWVPSR